MKLLRMQFNCVSLKVVFKTNNDNISEGDFTTNEKYRASTQCVWQKMTHVLNDVDSQVDNKVRIHRTACTQVPVHSRILL